jgi:F0F1-type ATP synthase delta subunit
MINYSRRQLARYAVDEMLAKRPIGSLASRLAAALTSTGRRADTELLLADIDLELEDRGLLSKAHVTSAYALPANARRDLAVRLKKIVGVKNVVMTEKIDKGVIGGVRIETATRTMDMTLKKALSDLKEVA